MRLIKNTGDNRVIDELRHTLPSSTKLDIAGLSLFAFGELDQHLRNIDRCRLLSSQNLGGASDLVGGDYERPYRNRLIVRVLAIRLSRWLEKHVDVKATPKPLPQSVLEARPGFSLSCEDCA